MTSTTLGLPLPPLPASYDDTNRLFVQLLMGGQRSISLPDTQRLLGSILYGAGTKPGDQVWATAAVVDQYVQSATEAIRPFEFDIRATYHQVTGTMWLTYVDTGEAMPSIFLGRSKLETAVIRTLLRFMFIDMNTRDSEVMAVCTQDLPVPGIGSTDPKNNRQGRRPLGAKTKEHQQQLLEELVRTGHMERSPAGYYSLAPRALADMKLWLVSTYNANDREPGHWQRIKDCTICQDIVTVGRRCGGLECGLRIHRRCEDTLWAQSSPKQCPGCGGAWEGAFVGEQALL